MTVAADWWWLLRDGPFRKGAEFASSVVPDGRDACESAVDRTIFTNAGKSTALWQSDDGFDWRLATHPLVAMTEITWENGQKQKQNSLERPQLFLEKGQPAVLLFATDTGKEREHSFNLRIPLRAP